MGHCLGKGGFRNKVQEDGREECCVVFRLGKLGQV